MKISLRMHDGWSPKVRNEQNYICDIDGARLMQAPHNGIYCDRIHSEEDVLTALEEEMTRSDAQGVLQAHEMQTLPKNNYQIMKIKTEVEIDNDTITSLLSSMRYSHYWCENANEFDYIAVQQKITDGGTHTAKEYDESDGKIIGRYPVSLKTLKKGLQLMATTQPEHFADIVSENDDATTADVLLQLTTLGEIKYG